LNNCLQFEQPCLLCRATTPEDTLCSACAAHLPWHNTACCPQCALPTPQGEVCGRCLGRPPAFDHTLAVFDYTFPVDALMHAFKYGGDFALARLLARPLAQKALTQPLPDVLFAMPLHAERLRERGFNQSLELAKFLGTTLGIPLHPDSITRIRHTPAQAGLPWKERRRNIRHAFACTEPLHGLHVALVDDVMTTGASMGELAATVRRAGAARIDVWVVARTLRREDDGVNSRDL
jgi:ComF family protein